LHLCEGNKVIIQNSSGYYYGDRWSNFEKGILTEFWILDFGFWILDFGFWILDFGLEILASKI
jgi:hypothetical protein